MQLRAPFLKGVHMTLLVCLLIAESFLILPDMTVSPSGIAGITSDTTLEDIEMIFGPENVEATREHIGEGYYSEGACIFIPGEEQLTVIFEEGLVSSITVESAGPKTAEGIGLGSSLTDLEEVIGEFRMAGFAWDYEGYADLQGTIYEGLYMRLTPEVGVPERFIGDEMFSSAELREYDPVITDFRVVF